jgi:transcription initiation factor IIE alpha subunit
MGQNTVTERDCQEERIKIKTLSQQMKNLAISGTGISPWEAEVLLETIEEVYFNDPEFRHAKQGQIKYSCISKTEPPGKPVSECAMQTVLLTLFDDTDKGDLSYTDKDASIEKRQRRLARIAEEAKEQNGLLSQEDLAELLMCDVRTIRRDIADFKELGIVVPTRGTVKDIGPGVTHRALAIRLWLEGKEPTEISRHIKHSIKAVENYLEKFKRVAYLKQKGFTHFETARTVGISNSATNTFIEIYDQFKGKALFDARLEEIMIVGSSSYQAYDEKKESRMSKLSMRERQVKQ